MKLSVDVEGNNEEDGSEATQKEERNGRHRSVLLHLDLDAHCLQFLQVPQAIISALVLEGNDAATHFHRHALSRARSA